MPKHRLGQRHHNHTNYLSLGEGAGTGAECCASTTPGLPGAVWGWQSTSRSLPTLEGQEYHIIFTFLRLQACHARSSGFDAYRTAEPRSPLAIGVSPRAWPKGSQVNKTLSIDFPAGSAEVFPTAFVSSSVQSILMLIWDAGERKRRGKSQCGQRKEIWYGFAKFRYSFFQSQGKKIDDATSLMLIDLLPA